MVNPLSSLKQTVKSLIKNMDDLAKLLEDSSRSGQKSIKGINKEKNNLLKKLNKDVSKTIKALLNTAKNASPKQTLEIYRLIENLLNKFTSVSVHVISTTTNSLVDNTLKLADVVTSLPRKGTQAGSKVLGKLLGGKRNRQTKRKRTNKN